MKKLFFSLLVIMACAVNAQDSYWTNYQVVVAPDEVEAVYNLVNDYYTANQPEGVTVTLWENHFKDHGNNSTHSLGFSGSLDAMGDGYGQSGDTWRLFLVQLNQHIEAGYSARMGTIMARSGDFDQEYPVQKYFIVHAEEGATWNKAFNKLLKVESPIGTTTMMGNFTSGVSPEGENRWVIQGFKDFKGAIGGASTFRTPAEQAARDKSWKVFRDTNGKSHLVRSGTRVRMGQWK
jgi:hypothetical protein